MVLNCPGSGVPCVNTSSFCITYVNWFTFLGERYERKSVMITSNLVFSQWDRIFKGALTTAAAIDRVVHHAHILKINLKKSYRAEEA
ncbi:MAG: ATP-binding protein [Deltaproteobacteria bacterium]|nr:ATP-binding protein [Deltaproteobacteria bacterium]